MTDEDGSITTVTNKLILLITLISLQQTQQIHIKMWNLNLFLYQSIKMNLIFKTVIVQLACPLEGLDNPVFFL